MRKEFIFLRVLSFLFAACSLPQNTSVAVNRTPTSSPQDADYRVLWNHRALAAVLGVILRLPPIKQALASQQVKSRYLEFLVTHFQPHITQSRKGVAGEITELR